MDPEDYEKPPEEKNPLEKLRDSFREEVEELVNLELDVEQLAQRKLEKFVGQWLLSAADPTPPDWVKLNQYLEHGENRLMAGEVAKDVELVCVSCGRLRVVEGSAVLRPCSRCGAGLYELRHKH